MNENLYQLLGDAKIKDFDIRLPKLGLMRFSMLPANDEGVYIMFFKKTIMEDVEFNPDAPILPSSPYCYAKVKLTELEKTLHAKMQKKLLRKISKLREWLIQQDLLLSQLQGSCREVKL